VNKRLREIALKGMEYYNGGHGTERKYNGTQQFNSEYNREQRLAFIKVLKEELSQIPIVKNSEGLYILDLEKMTEDQKVLCNYQFYDLDYKALRGSYTDKKLMPRDVPEINKWNPLLMYLLAEKHKLDYKEFSMDLTHGRLFLGKHLYELITPVKHSELELLSTRGHYYISSLGYKIRDKKLYNEESEQVNDDDEDRMTYKNLEAFKLRNYSPFTVVVLNDYPKSYEVLETKLSKDFMRSLITILDKPKPVSIPEGEEF